MDKFSYISNAEIAVFDDLYAQYRQNPESVDQSWKKFFQGFDFGKANYDETGSNEIPENIRKEFNVINLINAYRSRGHLFTKTNPVRERRKYSPTLDIENFGLTNADLSTVFNAGSEIGIGPTTLKAIIDHLQQTYCQSIGAEFKYIRKPEIVDWLQAKMEKSKNTPEFSSEEKKEILKQLTKAVVFENFLHTKFVGQKRFSVEGGEAMIPALQTIIHSGADLGIEEFVIGMAHRGRLNVLANVMQKPYAGIFTEFEGKGTEDSDYDGDVKYHLGYSSDIVTPTGKNVHLSLTANPSHLEAVDPVIEGITRAKIDLKFNNDYSKAAPIMIHGDAAVAGQGIVYEVIQMSQLPSYKTGGTIHLVINNQVGFTTNYTDGRSSTYCTDVAKVVLSPVFHVNGDDVEAMVFICKLAIEFRQKFHQDVFIDLLCYRKYGHNEGDEPRFTQPLLYKIIAKHPNPKEIYLNYLREKGQLDQSFADGFESEFKNLLQQQLDKSRTAAATPIMSYLEGHWKGISKANNNDWQNIPNTSVSNDTFLSLANKISTLPSDKAFFNKIKKLFDDRLSMIKNDNYDWAMGELMAYATLLNEGTPIRFTGQDVERGTFSHRHAAVRIEETEEFYTPLNRMNNHQAKLRIYNSLLSEYGVLGFEYGYSLSAPGSLTIWEAQFGDFFNGAQIMIDQFIASGEAKWRRMSGLVMLLPHGYEGQGPEHSSARIERWLQLSADFNWYVLNCTTPANFFHALRRQMKTTFRKPLVVFTPKSLLRHPKCVSSLSDFTESQFQPLIDDFSANVKKVSKIIFCSGKIYYDLLNYKEENKIENIAIIRLEQLFPLPEKEIHQVVSKYSNQKQLLWVQEEPANMGSWTHILSNLHDLKFKLISRKSASSPATGYSKVHTMQQQEIIKQAFN
jgi:2-oxoglutarate dehydrogenase E1 component